jgi:hypothetical protein
MAIFHKPVFAADISGSEVWQTSYDLVLVALGYEARSRHLACSLQTSSGRRLALPFESDRVCSFEPNLKALKERNFEIFDMAESDVSTWWAEQLATAPRSAPDMPLRVCIDVSSLTRLRLAHLIEAISKSGAAHSLLVDFVYTVAQFSPPLASSETATICGPVSPFLAGWPSDPEKPLAAVLGLGYELEKAIGALEYLEPSRRVLVKPISRDSRFDKEVDSANQGLLSSGSNEDIFSYPIDQPTQCLELLDALVHAHKDEYRIIAVPFGPKIFALSCMLIACRYYPEIGIWRISAETSRATRDQLPSDVTVRLRIKFDATNI